MRRFYFFALLFPLLCVSCSQNRIDGAFRSATPNPVQEDDRPEIAYNKKKIALENESINLFIKRYGWKPEITSTGLRIEILRDGNGALLKEGDKVVLKYETKLLSGEIVYHWQTDSVKRFIVNKSEEIAGLHEAARQLKLGSKARLIIPSYLAYGLAGDGNRIVGCEPLVMTVEVVESRD
ncbi:MAG: FKBP-type peptidyl-prolyl cis-trans isomerase [Bacteroidales bacterium]|jgi:FKBP-type peptidyl-prolyl cis-trans isomerase|nr:FKBP-type peptidyl-prolyl cis-trans isomerase [Bacteroidales bacterium]